MSSSESAVKMTNYKEQPTKSKVITIMTIVNKLFLFLTFSLILNLFSPISEAADYHLAGDSISLFWGVPFVGILLSIAIFPLVAPNFWHHHYGKVAVVWIITLSAPFLLVFGWQVTLFEALHVILLEYLPFIILLLSLYVTAGGVHIKFNTTATPLVNSAILTVGALFASLIGTTGAAMILIRPLISANQYRKHKVHIVVFFIFIVANIGGSLSPIGDPPLFLGFLKGVPFFWPTEHLFLPMLLAVSCLITTFFLIDTFLMKRKEDLAIHHTPAKFSKKDKHLHKTIHSPESKAPASEKPIVIEGIFNLCLLLCIVGAVIMSGFMETIFSFSVFGVTIDSQNLIRDLILLFITVISITLTSEKIRQDNFFSWEPILEVAKLFAGIFITITPVIAILKAGYDGQLSTIIEITSDANGNPINAYYFWITGILSSFLDNAPTYLVFFNLAGGNSDILTGELAGTLVAISVGAVFMGANTYIGNAPNFMVKAIAESRGIAMPSFFGYILWSLVFLFPLFILITYLFF